MHLRRAAQATPQVFTQPPVIQIGNSGQSFRANASLKKCSQFDKKSPSQLAAGWNLVEVMKTSLSYYFLHLWLVLFIITPAWSRAEGTLQNVLLVPQNDTVGVATTYLLSFRAPSGLPRNGKILIYFPAEFDISRVSVASNVTNLNGGFNVNIDLDNGDRVVILHRDNTGADLPINSTGTVKFSIVDNPITAGSYSFPRIATQDNNGNDLDEKTSGISVTIMVGAFDHFDFLSPIGNNQIAGQNFNFTILGKDALNNNVAVNDSIIFSDLTGMLTPKRVKMNNSELPVTANVTKAQNGVVITATAKTLGKNGLSNSFNVVPGNVAKFALSNVPNPSTAGAPFTLNITAQDASGNTVTSFNGSVNFAPSGKIMPATSGNFSNGVRNETIAYLESGNNKTVTVNSGSVISFSNSFTVNPGKPSGTIAFSANSKSIPADRNTTTQVNSTGPVQDAQGNNVGGGKFFTVSVNDTIFGTITTSDADLATPGIQITTNSSSGSLGRLNFAFKAGGKGGTATIFVSSVDGTASGSVSISVNQVRILSTTTTPATVSQGQRNIPVQMRVQNSGADTVSLDEANLSFADLSSDYSVKKPSPLPKIPGNDAIRTLTFSVNVSPNAQTGSVPISGQIAGELSSGQFFSDVGADTVDTWIVQTPAALSLAMRTSQATVTAGQTKRWNIFMKAKNAGESAAKVIFDENNPNRTTRPILPAGYIIAPAETDIIISGNDSTDIVFNVDSTGAAEDTFFNGQLFAQELNSDSVHSASGSARINVQQPAHVRVESMKLATVFNPDTVNAGQEFFVDVSVKQTVPAGAEKIDSVKVQLTAGNAAVLTNDLTLTDLTKPVSFKVKAGTQTQVRAGFDASISAAYSANTGANTVNIVDNPILQKPSAYIQKPGSLVIDSLKTSESRVRFGRTLPWSIFLFAKNPAAASDGGIVVIDSTRLTFKVGQAVQNDYTIINTNPADSLFTANRRARLTFNVTKTGTTGGTVTITATVYFHDRNSLTKRSVSRTTTIIVESTALVTIAKTSFPPAVNRLTGTEIALVDTGQVFPINVTVRNTGFERVKNVVVSLRSTAATNPSSITPKKVRIGPIDTESGTAAATFTIRAAATTNSIGEAFTARIDSAYTFGGLASIAPALDTKDTTAVARLELPARLQLSLTTTDGATAYGVDQPFTIRARVKNLGEAQIDNSGRLTLSLPPEKSYRLADNEPAQKSFAANDSVEWNVFAHKDESLNDRFLATMSAPLDKNSGKLAATVGTPAQITVSTLRNSLRIADKFILAPAGARDRTISTEQIFIAGVKIQASSNLTNKTVTLTLPIGSGFSFVNGEVATKEVTADTIRWQLQAPRIENLNPVTLLIDANAFNGPIRVSSQDGLVILRTENRAILYLDPGIKETTNQNGRVAVNQTFTLVARLRNTGLAFVKDTAKVTIDVSQTGITLLGVPGKTSTKFVVFQPGENSKEISWQAKASSQSALPETITFEITQRPRDVNTGLEVLTSNDPATFKVQTAVLGTLRVANFRITGPVGAQDNVLSTDQEFTVSDSVYWSNATNVHAQLILPPGFETVNEIQPLIGAGIISSARPLWRVRTHEQPASNAELKVIVTAKDANDTTAALPQVFNTMLVQVEKRADPRLRADVTSPPAATDGKVSAGQLFEVTVRVENQGQALLTRAASVRVDLSGARGYKLVNASDSIQTSTNSLFNWRIRAREDISDETDLIIFKLQSAPFDTNTNQPAMSTLSQAPLILRTEAKKLLVEKVGKSGGPVANGQKDLPLLRLILTNPGGTGSSNLVLRQLSFKLYNRDRQEVAPPNKALQTIRVVHDTKRDTLYGELQNLQAAPLRIDFAKNVIVAPNKPDTIAILGNIVDNPTASSFRIAFESGQDFDVVDQDSGSVVIVENKEGNSGSAFRLDSDLTVLFAADPEKSFFNYPNPFQPGNNIANGQGTHFAYNLREASSGVLKIVTLLGELVWETSFTEIDPAGRIGPHTTDIFWDGHNGAGQRVLNGVYVAILKTKDGKMLTTKVAVLKK